VRNVVAQVCVPRFVRVAGSGAASPGAEAPGWNDGKAAEAGLRSVASDSESAEADFVLLLPRVHSPPAA